jgi:hypothetical protein
MQWVEMLPTIYAYEYKVQARHFLQTYLQRRSISIKSAPLSLSPYYDNVSCWHKIQFISLPRCITLRMHSERRFEEIQTACAICNEQLALECSHISYAYKTINKLPCTLTRSFKCFYNNFCEEGVNRLSLRLISITRFTSEGDSNALVNFRSCRWCR